MPVHAVRPLRRWLVFLSALVLAGLATATSLVARSADASLRLAQGWLNADLVVVPAGCAESVARGLVLGEPVPAHLPYDSAQRIAAIPGVAAASAQLYLRCPLRGASCAVPGQFLVAYDPATDFTLRPFLERSLPQGLAPGSALGGSAATLPRGEEMILVYGCPLRLAGSLPATGTNLDRALFFTLETAHQVAAASFGAADPPLRVPLADTSSVLVRLRPDGDPRAVTEEVERQVPGATAAPAGALLAGFRAQADGLQQGMLAALGVAAALWGACAALRRTVAGSRRSLDAGIGAPVPLRPGEESVEALGGAGLGAALACVAVRVWGVSLSARLGLPFLPSAVPASVAVVGLALALAALAPAAGMAGWRRAGALTRAAPAHRLLQR